MSESDRAGSMRPMPRSGRGSTGKTWIPVTTGIVGARPISRSRRLLTLRILARRGKPHDRHVRADPAANAFTGRRAEIAMRLKDRRARRQAHPVIPAATPIDIQGPHEGVLVVRLAGGARRNVLGRSTVAALDAVFSAPPPGTRVVLLLGDPPDFCAGYDLIEAGSTDPEALIASPANFEAMRRCTVPVVAALEGNVIGGGLELALLADVRVAATRTRLAIPASQLGVVYSFEGIALLVSVLGESTARAMLLAGRVMEAEAALAAGIVVELAPPERLGEAALTLARTIASWPDTATSGNRQVLDVVAGRKNVDVAALRLASFRPNGELAESIRRFSVRHNDVPRGAAHSSVLNRLRRLAGGGQTIGEEVTAASRASETP